MKALVFAVAGYNLAETGRMIEIAREARKHFNVIFASYGGQFEIKMTSDTRDREGPDVMDEVEKYEFDRQGYLVIRNILTDEQVATLAAAVDALEEHALALVGRSPRRKSARGAECHVDGERGYHVRGEKGEGKSLIIEDFWNPDPAFDMLADHEPTMHYIHAIVQSRPTINNSEIRIRYPGNATHSHGGSRTGNQKYRYGFGAQGIDCMMVRMVYFIHDVGKDDGAFCVVPGTHKTSLPCPYGNDPDEDPGMVGLEVTSGDAILFTEDLRHGGLTNRSNRPRKTLHVGYGPYWLMSQNILTMDEPQYITDETNRRYTEAQRNLFRPWPPS